MSYTTATDPLDAMGHPIDPDGRQEVIRLLMDLDRDMQTAMIAADQVAVALEANEPKLAFVACRTFLGASDVTLHFRVVATLLAHANAETPQQRGGQGLEALVEAQQ